MGKIIKNLQFTNWERIMKILRILYVSKLNILDFNPQTKKGYFYKELIIFRFKYNLNKNVWSWYINRVFYFYGEMKGVSTIKIKS